VANHACSPDSEQLKMYIAGMGGTGKTQVLKALVELFKIRNESHRFIIVAPTGSAAALLQGSTYHSMFGINSDGKHTSAIQLAQVKERLQGVDYIFLDEVSMLSCRDMYLICARLAHVMNNLEAPFGGLNIIFAGEFAQLWS
jgi:PIF1-like helicase